MIRAFLLWQIAVLLGCALALGAHPQGQAAPRTSDSAIAALAVRLSERLHEAGAKRVVVLDLRGPGGEPHSVGKWLADHLSSQVQKDLPDLQVIDRALKSNSNDGERFSIESSDNQKALDFGRSLGADAVIRGSFAKVSRHNDAGLRAEGFGASAHHWGCD